MLCQQCQATLGASGILTSSSTICRQYADIQLLLSSLRSFGQLSNQGNDQDGYCCHHMLSFGVLDVIYPPLILCFPQQLNVAYLESRQGLDFMTVFQAESAC